MSIAVMSAALVLLIVALVFRSLLLVAIPLLLVSTICWVIFAFLTFSYAFANTYLNTAFLMLGGAMAFVSLFIIMGLLTAGRAKGPTLEDEQETYKKKVLEATRGR